MSAPAPEVVTIDVGRYGAGAGVAIVQRHEITATGVVEFDIWTVSGDFAHNSCGDADTAVDYGTVVVQAGHKLRELQQHGAR